MKCFLSNNHLQSVIALRINRSVMAIVCSVVLFSSNANAAMDEEQSLHFGTFALVNNTTVSTLKIFHTGATPDASSKLYPLSFGQAGHYRLTAYPVFTPLTITIADFTLNVGMAEPFTISAFTHDAIITDGAGEALLKLGATLSTSGTGTNYGDAVYTGIIDIQVSF
ncbi:hypothetical protein A9Q81_19045 [Gammaproteobacteria bacterium 42_54_T18]|nr:hypothetical protein A9Q81_19045 [Gammaproteobacteria bacterium 42_54_T18]